MGLTLFRVRFGLLTLKACTKGEHVLRFEATAHNAKQLGCRRTLENFDQIIARLAGMASGSAPRWTASMSDSCPTARSMSCRCPPGWAPARSAAST